MADIKISQLNTASEIQDSDNIELSQDISGVLTSTKTSIDALSTKVTSGVVNSIATVEVSPSANNYAVGDYLMYNRQLYKVISAITSGQTLVVGTNIQAVAVTNEMGSGGGGTGGHTIIDENGNSMTARAGLQFVGANVSDDATDNRTIVDLASAGGIDGVFIDTENVIQASTNIVSGTTASYTATEDCYVKLWGVARNNTDVYAYIDGTEVARVFEYSSNTAIQIYLIPLKKGQTFTATTSYTEVNSTYTVYGIQTGTTHSKFQPVIYSTEEREIGVWIDGKPLYEKTFTFSQIQSGADSWFNTGVDISSLNIEVFGDTKLIASSTGGNIIYDGISSRTSNDTLQCMHFRNANANFIGAIVQYTKSTDTAGSGSWTPQGVPAVHYSTDEHIVGTWIDGSTLYEKTYTGLDIAVAYNTWTNVVEVASDTDILVDVKILASTTEKHNITGSGIEFYLDKSTHYVKAEHNQNVNKRNIGTITLQYTKSS